MKFILEDSDESLTTQSGLGLIGLLLSKTKLSKRFNDLSIPEIKTKADVSNGDVITSYIGLLAQSKNDFERIEPFREEPFFKLALDLKSVPSSSGIKTTHGSSG